MPVKLGDKRGHYRPIQHQRILDEIRSMLIDGSYSYQDIIQKLGVHERTFYRYLHELFENDRRMLAQNFSDDDFLNEMALCKNRLLHDRRQIQQWLQDPKFKDKVGGMHLSSEIACAILRLHVEGPGYLFARHQFPRNSLVGRRKKSTAGGVGGGEEAELVLMKEGLQEAHEGEGEEEEEYRPPPEPPSSLPPYKEEQE